MGSGDVIDILKKRSCSKDLINKVLFTGKLNYPDMMQYTMNATVGVSLDKDTNINYRLSLPNKIFDYVKADEGSPGAGVNIEIYQSSFSEGHEWSYYPKMNRDEVVMFKTFDSTENPFLPTLHSAFDDVSSEGKAISPRESIEVRAVCFFN